MSALLCTTFILLLLTTSLPADYCRILGTTLAAEGGVRPRGLPLSNHLLVCGLFVAKLLIMCGRCQKCGAQRMFAISGGRWSAFSRCFMDYIYFKPAAAVSAKTIKHEMNRVHLFISY